MAAVKFLPQTKQKNDRKEKNGKKGIWDNAKKERNADPRRKRVWKAGRQLSLLGIQKAVEIKWLLARSTEAQLPNKEQRDLLKFNERTRYLILGVSWYLSARVRRGIFLFLVDSPLASRAMVSIHWYVARHALWSWQCIYITGAQLHTERCYVAALYSKWQCTITMDSNR